MQDTNEQKVFDEFVTKAYNTDQINLNISNKFKIDFPKLSQDNASTHNILSEESDNDDINDIGGMCVCVYIYIKFIVCKVSFVFLSSFLFYVYKVYMKYIKIKYRDKITFIQNQVFVILSKEKNSSQLFKKKYFIYNITLIDKDNYITFFIIINLISIINK